MANPVSKAMFMNRMKAYMNQIQQYSQNPQIGRALSTQTFSSQAPAVAAAPTAQSAP
jgi:hypothetical protein